MTENKSPLNDSREIDIDDDEELRSSILAPFGTVEEIEEALNDLYKKTKDEKLLKLISLAFLSINKNGQNGFTIGNDWVNNLGDTDFISRLSMRSKPGKNEGKTAVMAAKALLGVGKPIDIKLVHSGFSIRLDAQDQYSKTMLYSEIAKSATEAGMSTSSLVFNNDHSLFSRIIMDFVADNLISSTLKVPTGKNIMDYILLEDDYAIMLGVMSTLFTDGFDITLGCRNTLKVSNDTTACGNVIKGKIDPAKTLHVDTSRLTDYQKEQLLITKANTIYVDEKDIPKKDSKNYDESKTYYSLEKYRGEESMLTYNKEIDIDHEVGGNKVPIRIELAIPSYNRYFDFSTRYLSEIEEIVDEVITSNSSEEERIELMRDASVFLIINNSSHYINYIKIGESYYNNHDDVYDILKSIVSDQQLTSDILSKINAFKKEATIAIAGTPLYQCDKCGNVVGEATDPISDSVTPINPYYFFSRLQEVSM